MAVYTVIRINKCKTGAVSKLNRHHERLKEEYKSNPDIHPGESGRNYHLIIPEESYRKIIRSRIRQVGAKQRKDSVVMQDGLITATPEWIKAKTDAEQKEFFEYALKFIIDRYGKDNMISAVVHMDETTPHMHFSFVPITDDGKLSSKTIIGGPKGLVKLQDDFYRYISKRYPEISRGIPAKVTHRTHVPSYLYKNAAMLYSHYEEICGAIRDIGLLGNAKKKEDAIALLGRYAPEMAKMKDQLKITDRKVEELERSLMGRDSSLKYYRSQNKEQEKTIENLQEKLMELHRIQTELQARIDRIPHDLLRQMEEREKRRRKEERETR